MDDENQRRRLNDAPQFAGANPSYGQEQSHGAGQGRGYPSQSSDRYRLASMNTTSTARGMTGPSAAYTPYYSDTAPSFPAAMSATTLPYNAAAEYSADQRQQQSYAGYSTSMMYNVGQQAAQNAVYDASQQYQSRQPSSLQLPSQLPPDVGVSFYGSEPNSASGPPVLQHGTSSSSSINYPASSVHGYTPSLALGSMASESIDDQGAVQSGGATEAYETYHDALKQIFYDIREGRLAEASASTLEVSNWLLSNVGQLGLTGDDEALHSDRLKLWNEFNTAWLAMLQKQKDLTLESFQRGIRPRPPQTLISQSFLQKMANELVRLGDGVEKHGLVDYQLGVWEESIADILIQCLDLLENDVGAGDGRALA
ncbi:MAG: hypothetical protein M1818_000246 [Claussenomyces sp. TS43310]|nr:MAG: hypothetical protein M1818_000246 [Claussenomyces sp. TS43310]